MLNKKLSVIGAAAAAVVERAELEVRRQEAAREAALRMPIKDAMRELHGKLQADLDAALQLAVERRLGAPLTDPDALRGRLEVAGPDEEGADTYILDGVPLLWAGPIGLSRDGDAEMGATRTLRHLWAETNEM